MKALAALLLMTTAVLAEDRKMSPVITDEELAKLQPTEETKKRALLRAYEINGHKMCCGFVDVSSDPYVLNAKPIKIERILPDLDPAARNEIDDLLMPPPQPKKKVARLDVCEQHGMHKVTTKDGTSWRCRKK